MPNHNDTCPNDDYCSEPYHDYGFGHHHYDRRDKQHDPAYYPTYDAGDGKHHHHGPDDDLIVHNHNGVPNHFHQTGHYNEHGDARDYNDYGPRNHDHDAS